ncbi:MAG: hypothetical protein PHH14_06790, partial [Candidatus Margulisbacteria bacterium]|nr:hypothetical protein [Candidatus Margulisiibacteriota bacterium]
MAVGAAQQVTTTSNKVRLGIRGLGGEIGDTTIRVLLAMNRTKFDACMMATGGVITTYIRSSIKGDIQSAIRADRSFKKLSGTGSLRDNTASSYAFGKGAVRDLKFGTGNNKNRLTVIGQDNRVLNIDYVIVPETNNNLDVLRQIDLLLETTGQGVKDEKNPEQVFSLYSQYENLVTVASSPVKKVMNPVPPHQFNGLKLAKPGQLNATGSCSTHAGVDLVRYIREPLMR